MSRLMRGISKSYWDSFFKGAKDHHLSKGIALYKRREIERIIKKWVNQAKRKLTLKTDCYEEVFKHDSFIYLFDNIVIIDISSEGIKKAKKNFSRRYVIADVSTLPFPDNSFDLVISTSTIDNIPHYKVFLTIAEMYRILRRGGLLILTVDNRKNILYHLLYQINKKLGFTKFYQDRCFLPREIRGILLKSKFKIKKVEYAVQVLPFNFLIRTLEKVNFNLATYFSKILLKISRKLSFEKLKPFISWFVVVICRK